MSYWGSIAGKGRHGEEMKARTEIDAITLKAHCVIHISEVLLSTGMPFRLTNTFLIWSYEAVTVAIDHKCFVSFCV